MAATDSKVTIHMVASLDGFIAGKDGDVTWLETSDSYEEGVTGESAEDFMNEMTKSGCFVIGSRTYESALKLGWCYGDVPTFVLTHRELSSDRDSVQFYAGDLKSLVDDRLRPNYRQIWLCGGATVVSEFIRSGLADELVYSIAPVMIGDGVPFFDRVRQQTALHLRKVSAYKSGVVELTYDILKE